MFFAALRMTIKKSNGKAKATARATAKAKGGRYSVLSFQL
jgi:hypothetical protein